jgi:PKD repeat protein
MVTLTVGGGCGADTLIKQNFINISPSLPCLYYMTSGVQYADGCNGIIYDDGGPDGNYSNNLNSQIIVHSTGATSFTLSFIEFDVEAGAYGSICNYDYLSVYAGNSTSAPLIGTYCNNNRPPVTPITINGEYFTLRFHSDQAVNGAGFKIEFTCVNPNLPTALFEADLANLCTGIIHFTDQSTGQEINSWLWNFGDGGTSTLQNPTHQYYANGEYNVTLTVKSLYGEDTKMLSIIIKDMKELDDQQFKVVINEPFELFVPNASVNLKWYANKEGNLFETTPLLIGNPIQHLAIAETITYYIIDADECFSELAVVTIVPEIIDTIGISRFNKFNVTVSPNPTTGELRITNYELRMGDVGVYDIYGRQQKAESRRQKADEVVLDISHLAAGVYILRVGNGVFKVVKN